jgi:hypothetical protein
LRFFLNEKEEFEPGIYYTSFSDNATFKSKMVYTSTDGMTTCRLAKTRAKILSQELFCISRSGLRSWIRFTAVEIGGCPTGLAILSSNPCILIVLVDFRASTEIPWRGYQHAKSTKVHIYQARSGV